MPDIAQTHMAYGQRQESWRRIRDALEGELAIKAAGEKYLPRPEAMSVKTYNAYKERASFYGVADRTLRGLVGMVYRIAPIIKVPSSLKERVERATSDGLSFIMWTVELVSEVMSLGRYGILVDYPEDGAAAGTAPYFSTYKAEHIRDWKVEFRKDQRVLTRLILSDDSQAVGSNAPQRLLELYLDAAGVYTVQVWIAMTAGERKTTKLTYTMDKLYVPTVNGKPLGYIPFVFVGPVDLQPECTKAPFADLANMNVAHYRNSADYENSLYMTSQPTPVVIGTVDEKARPKVVGTSSIWFLPQGSDAKYLEFTGAALASQKIAMEDKEARMAVLGARLIKDSDVSNVAAETIRLKTQVDTSTLTSVVRACEAALKLVYEMAAEWQSGEKATVEVTLNKDFIETRMNSQDLDSLVKAWQGGAISRDTMHRNLQRGEIMAPDRTVEDEVGLIEEEGGMTTAQPPPEEIIDPTADDPTAVGAKEPKATTAAAE